MAESFNAALKREVLQDDTCWPDAPTCRRDVFRWLVGYNIKRRHSYCNHVSPATYERIHTPATPPEAAEPQIPCPLHGAKAPSMESDHCGGLGRDSPTISARRTLRRPRSPGAGPAAKHHGQEVCSGIDVVLGLVGEPRLRRGNHPTAGLR